MTSISLALIWKITRNYIITYRVETIKINKKGGPSARILGSDPEDKKHETETRIVPIISTRNKPFQPASPSPLVSAHRQVAFPLLPFVPFEKISAVSLFSLLLPPRDLHRLSFFRIITESCNSSSGGRAFF